MLKCINVKTAQTSVKMKTEKWPQIALMRLPSVEAFRQNKHDQDEEIASQIREFSNYR